MTFPEDITIYDTTLRDGEQTPGVCFSFDEKLEIARKLDQFKIHQIEAGFPIVSEREKQTGFRKGKGNRKGYCQRRP